MAVGVKAAVTVSERGLRMEYNFRYYSINVSVLCDFIRVRSK